MLKALGSHLTYANVMATVAVFLALGGGAYALSGIPDRSGVYHGCASNRNGALRVVKSATSCQRARGRGTHRNPGESAISWSQKGPRGLPGLQGAQGLQGVQGVQGAQGQPGPTFGAVVVGQGLLSDPPASPDETSAGATTSGRHFDFTLPSSGRVYVRFFSNFMNRDCSSGTAGAGLYLDGAPVPKTEESVNGTADASSVAEYGAIVTAAAGPHTAEVRENCPSGNLGPFGDSGRSTWSGLLLGS